MSLLKNQKQASYNIAGVAMQVGSYDEQVQTIKDLKPSLKDLLVPYDSIVTHGGFTERFYGPTEAFCKSWRKFGGRVRAVDISDGSQIEDTIASYASRNALVNLSVQSTVLTKTNQIVAACNRQDMPVYSHSQQGVRAGAVFGSGYSGSIYGPPVAYLIGQVFVDGKDLSTLSLPIVQESSDLCYLEPALQTQGFSHLNEDRLRTMRMLPIQHVE